MSPSRPRHQAVAEVPSTISQRHHCLLLSLALLLPLGQVPQHLAEVAVVFSHVPHHLARESAQMLVKLPDLLPLLAQDARHRVVHVHAQLVCALNRWCARLWHARLARQSVNTTLHRAHARVCAHLLFGHLVRKGGCLPLHPAPVVLGAGIQMPPQLFVCVRALLAELFDELPQFICAYALVAGSLDHCFPAVIVFLGFSFCGMLM